MRYIRTIWHFICVIYSSRREVCDCVKKRFFFFLYSSSIATFLSKMSGKDEYDSDAVENWLRTGEIFSRGRENFNRTLREFPNFDRDRFLRLVRWASRPPNPNRTQLGGRRKKFVVIFLFCTISFSTFLLFECFKFSSFTPCHWRSTMVGKSNSVSSPKHDRSTGNRYWFQWLK